MPFLYLCWFQVKQSRIIKPHHCFLKRTVFGIHKSLSISCFLRTWAVCPKICITYVLLYIFIIYYHIYHWDRRVNDAFRQSRLSGGGYMQIPCFSAQQQYSWLSWVQSQTRLAAFADVVRDGDSCWSVRVLVRWGQGHRETPPGVLVSCGLKHPPQSYKQVDFGDIPKEA